MTDQANTFAAMGKTELRAACKAAEISGYSKMTVAEMRSALEFAQPVRTETKRTDDEYVELAKSMDHTKLDESGVEGHCPCCGIDLSNGVAHYADIVDTNPDGAKDMRNEWTCLGCGGEWGEAVNTDAKPKRAAPTGKGLPIEKNREERNGIKRPSVGGKCRAIWDWLDSQTQPTAKMVRAEAETAGWNVNNAVIEFYQWRKFNA